MIKLLIADDHAYIREGIKNILKNNREIAVEDEASTGEEVLELINKKKYDVVVLDITMPGRNGIEILQQIKIIKPELHVIMLSVYPEEQFAVQSLKAGACAYLSKECAPEELIQAVLTVYGNKKYITQKVSEELLLSLNIQDDKTPLHKKLSNREFEVMLMIAKGKMNKEIAKELFISEKSVTAYRSRILEKMNFKNNYEIIKYALEKKLIS